MILSRVPRLVLFVAAATAVLLVFVLMHGVAHAADVPPVPAAPGWSMTEVLLLIGVILFAIRLFVDGIRAVLAFVAPRTTSTFDDKLLATFNTLHDRITALEALFPRTPGPVDPGLTLKRDPQAGKSTLGTMTVMALGAILLGGFVGFAAVGVTGGCATVRPVAGSAVTAELDCTSAALVDTAKSLGNAAEAYLAGKIAGDGRTVDTAAIKTDLKALGSKAWSCALSVALNVVLSQASSGIAHATSAAPSPDWRGVLGAVKAESGVTAIRLPDGSVI